MNNNKNLPKAWKKKKQSKGEKMHLLQKNKRPVNLNSSSASWKILGIVFLASLITIILVIPSVIVVPYVSDDKQQDVTEEKESGSQVEIAMGDSPFSVAVMRSDTEKVENVPLETYVARVVASETPAEFEMEALKAQALAARTYIVNRMLHQGDSKKPDVGDTIYDQVYHNKQELQEIKGDKYEEEMSKIKKAVAATKGEIVTYESAPITPAFFSTSNGYTENSEDYWKNKVPYLRSVKSPWDVDTPKYLDQKIFTIGEVEEKLQVDLPNQKTLAMEITRTEGKRVDQLKVADKTYSGRKVREKLKLRSSDFTIEQKNNHLIFTTEGYGHGIGMSQYGANGMAKAGKSYKDIVKHYYQGVEVSTLNDTAPTLVAK
ncbi:stage II sporulation protein D [Virgibacillus doumboii]|uniref:stage II sporulation protein D n=1 Tax=Virgibacillus doumboii TaxID=2697503 RepID=UPI0013DF0762|nr:stage II sporulation protein D [Virgibacillus doumboii]